MKKTLALILALCMTVGVCVFAGCAKDDETTAESTTVATTTETTTAAPVTTTESTTVETTTETTTQTTTQVTTVPTTAESTVEETTSLPIFARFDFGTKTKAEAEGLTSHEYLTGALTYDKSAISVTYTEDTIVITAMKSYSPGDKATAFALCFEDIVTYDFDDELIQGYGTYDGAPTSQSNVGNPEKWRGLHQFMKVRILNTSTNNMIAVQWHRSGEGYSTRTLNTCMYLQGGEPKNQNNHNLKTAVTNEWATYTYDMVFLAGLGREVTTNSAPHSYAQAVQTVKNKGSNFQHNWNTAAGNITGLQFHFLGALGAAQKQMTDSRSNIMAGVKVEVDYVLFGSSPEQLATYTSYIEDQAA